MTPTCAPFNVTLQVLNPLFSAFFLLAAECFLLHNVPKSSTIHQE